MATKVVNDYAERGISLVEEYNFSLIKDEEQKQFLLRLVDLHRTEVSSHYKSHDDEADWQPLISD